VTAGTLLFAGIRQTSATNVLSSVTDTRGNTWNILGRHGTGTGITSYVAWCINVGSGANTVTFNQTTSEITTTGVAEFTLSNTGALDLADLTGASTSTATGTSYSTNSRTPTASNGGGVSLFVSSSLVAAITPTGGETNVTGDANARLHILFEAFASATAQQHTATGANSPWTMALTLFSDTAGGGGGSGFRSRIAGGFIVTGM
jgi:hypothetical protein